MGHKTILDYSIKEDRMFVIGNGPSFAKSMERYGDLLSAGPCMTVNMFPVSDEYQAVKPRYYTAVDPNVYSDKDKVFPGVHDMITVLRDKTDWDITVFVPNCFYDSYFVREIQKNSRLQVVTFCDRIRTGRFFSREDVRMALQERNLLIPPSQTVLNLALWLPVFYGVKEIYLMGADTSYMEEIRIDQENNDVVVTDNHFNNSFTYRESDKDGRSVLAIELADLAKALREYEYVGRYAKKKGVRIYNASEYSYIDVYERKKPEIQ